MDTDPLIYECLKRSFLSIARFFYLVNYKIHRKHNARLYRITFKKTSGLTSTYLNISSNNRFLSKQMKFSIAFNEYYLEIWLPPRSEFYITQQNTSFLIDSFPQISSATGKLVNVIPEPKRFKAQPVIIKSLRSLVLNHIFECAGYSIGKLFYLNEDAYFCTERVIGVADGIGSLKRDFGISSHDFSTELMIRCEEFVRTHAFKAGSTSVDCKEIIRQAYNSIECGGGSTFLLASLSGRQMNILNLGDCGMILVRFDGKHKIVFQTTAKIHSFNTPYQLSRRFSIQQLKNTKLDRIEFDKSDDISDADEFMITTMPGDIAIMGSDGLWDNLYPQEILKILEQYKGQPLDKLASIIVKIAKIRAIGNSNTPFSVTFNNQAKKSKVYAGGKIDDITVVVARISIKSN
ncbi:hypothetical protein SteCoe_15411 [Stentor coeruleus]|uniref:Protein phosphatase n=1 Tax=Stentor coeruleus TaxID=5963 RepID=A0A1R2C3M3_9CILI|nr:hypothetical protein SteCoe_15411 [Stentor coeruleus]